MVDSADLLWYYKHNFELLRLKMMSLAELEDMLPFERAAYMAMVKDMIDEASKKNK